MSEPTTATEYSSNLRAREHAEHIHRLATDTEPITLTFTRAGAILVLGCAMTQGTALPPGDLQKRCVEQWLALQNDGGG